MNEKQQKRWRELQRDAQKDVGDYLCEKLTYPDIVLLLQQDLQIRTLIREILECSHQEEVVSDDKSTSTDLPVYDRHERTESCVGPLAATPPKEVLFASSNRSEALREQLAPELALLARFRSDTELVSLWLLNDNEPEGRQLLRLVALLAQWDQILQLWDHLAQRCKAAQRPASEDERQILAAALDIHNLIWHGRAARLQSVVPGTAFHFKQHERGVQTGEIIRAQWLPGLLNAAGQLQKKPLVET